MLTIAGGIVLAVVVLGLLGELLHSRTFWFMAGMLGLSGWFLIEPWSALVVSVLALSVVAAQEVREWRRRRDRATRRQRAEQLVP